MEELFFAFSYVSYYFYEILTIFIGSLALKKLWNRIFHGYNLPPGPWGLPLVGYFPFVSDLPHLTFNKLAKKYGPVFSLNIGFRYCVVLNDFESVKEAYQKEALSGRAPGTFKLPSKCETPDFSEQSGEMWRDHKKLFLAFTRDISKPEPSGKSSLEDCIANEVERFMSNIENSLDSPVNVRENLVDFMYKVVFGYLMGKDISEDNPDIIRSLSAQHTPLLYTGTVKALGQSFTQLSFFTKRWEPLGDAFTKATIETEAALRKVIEEHKHKLNVEAPKDYVDYFLIQQKDSPSSSLYTDDILVGNLQVLILGGSHTVRGTLEWLFMLLAQYQDVQKRIYQEIQAEVANGQMPTWELKNRLTFTYATILESIRLFTLAPVNTPRWATEDTTIKGFDIPKGTVVYSNNWMVNHEPNHWKDPLDFAPERFLDEDDPKKMRSSERVISFSYGRRECPGKQQAMMEVFLLLARTVQKYHIQTVEGHEPLDAVQKTMISMPNNPHVLFQKRA